jgi:hypothetical protein
MVSLPSEAKSRLSSLTPTKGEYCRLEQLPRLLKLWPSELDDYSYLGTLKVMELLRKALRAERCRAITGYSAYDLNRHMDLIQAIKHEGEFLQMLEHGLPSQAGTGKLRSAGTLRLPCSKKTQAEPLSCGS